MGISPFKPNKPTNNIYTTNFNSENGSNFNDIWIKDILGREPKNTTNVSTNFSSGLGGNFFPSSQPTMAGVGSIMRQQGIAGMPSVEQFHGGLQHDLNEEARINKINFDRKQEAANLFLGLGNEALQNIKNPKTSGQQFFDEARKFREAGAAQAAEDHDKYTGQVAEAAKKQQQMQQQASGMYDKAIGQVGQGTDKIASAMSAAAARRSADQGDQMESQMSGALPGTESQLEDARRTNRRDLDETVFGGVSQLQNQANQMQAQLMSGKGNLMSAQADSAAQFNMATAQFGANSAQSKNSWNKLGMDVALGNASFMAQINQVAGQFALNLGQGYAALNPNVMGISVMPTLMAMSGVAERYGQSNDLHIAPGNRNQTTHHYSDAGLVERMQNANSAKYAKEQGWNWAPDMGRGPEHLYGSPEHLYG